MQASRCSVWRDAVICGGVEVNQSSGTAALHQSRSFGPGQPSISPALAALTRATVGTCCTGEEKTDVRPREHSVRAASQSPAARNASWGRWPSVIGSAVTAHRNCKLGYGAEQPSRMRSMPERHANSALCCCYATVDVVCAADRLPRRSTIWSAMNPLVCLRHCPH